MTNMTHPSTSPDEPPWRGSFQRMLSDFGVTDVHGLELLRLVKMCAHMYDRALSQEMRETEISEPQWRMLMRLAVAAHTGQESLSPTGLAHSQRLSKNTISAHLRALEQAGLIERELDPDDLRAFRIRLSAAGWDLVRRSTPAHMAFLNRMAEELTPEEANELQALLAKLYESVRRAHQKGRPGNG